MSTSAAAVTGAYWSAPKVSGLSLLAFASIIGVWVGFIVGVAEPMTFIDATLAASVVALTIMAGTRYLQSRGDELPFLTFALLHFSLLFALPVLWPDTTIRAWASHQPYLRQALLLVVLCALALCLGHGLATRFLKLPVQWVAALLPQVSAHTLKAKWLIAGLIAVSIVVGALTNLAIGTDRLGPLSFVLSTALDPVFLFALAAYAYYRGHWQGGRIVFWGMFLLLLGSGAFTGQIDPMLKPVLVVLVARFVLLRKLPVWIPLLLIIGFVLVNPIKNQYRQLMRGDEGVSVVEIGSIWFQAWSAAGYGARPERAARATQARLNELVYVANAVEAVPHRVDYQYGYPWRSMLVAFVPRVLWPDKPDIRRIYPTEWGVQFGYIDAGDHGSVAMNLPLPVDGYWNFGVAGVALVGLILGLVLGGLRLLVACGGAMTFGLGATLLVSMHANMSLGASIGDLPFRFVLLAMLVVGLNLLTAIIPLVRLGSALQPGQGSPS